MIVEEFMVEDNTEAKINMVKKEVSQSRDNAADFLTKASQCGYKLEEAGVPLLFHNGKCFMGDKDIIDYLKENKK